jgi:hypothetical protein
MTRSERGCSVYIPGPRHSGKVSAYVLPGSASQACQLPLRRRFVKLSTRDWPDSAFCRAGWIGPAELREHKEGSASEAQHGGAAPARAALRRQISRQEHF